jgi:dethiobiotin synthetase
MTEVRPQRLVVVVGTGTDVGKTWVSARVIARARARGFHVAARKMVQSFDPVGDPNERDAAVLARASGEPVDVVCPPNRSLALAMAPPIAAAELGLARFTVADLVAELAWPPRTDAVGTLGIVETAGGVRSPLGDDGDVVDLVRMVRPDLVVLVAPAGLGALHLVGSALDSLDGAAPIIVVLNRFDRTDRVHITNRLWLERAGVDPVGLPGDEAPLLARVLGSLLAPSPTV